MYKREFESLIRQNNLPKSILLYGVCDFQITYFGNLVSKMWMGESEEALTFYFDAYDFTTLKQHLSQSSLFGNKNIAILKTDKTIPKKELDIFIDICYKSENSHLLVQCYSDEQKSKNMAKSFTKKRYADFVRFFKPNTNEAIQMLNREAQKLNLNIEHFALQHLLAIHNEDLSLAANELSKLSILDHEIMKKDIDMLVFGLGEVNLDDFVGNLLDKKDIKKEFEVLTQSGQYDEIYILNTIENYITQLFAFHSYIKLHGTFDSKAILGYSLPKNIAEKRAAQSMRMQLDVFQNILHTLTFAEYTLKKGSFSDKNTYILSTLLKLQSLIK